MRLPDPDAAPLALWELARSTAVGDEIELDLPPLDPEHVSDLVEGGAFEVLDQTVGRRGVRVVARRRRSLADSTGPGMGILVCGLNPSEYAADAGVPFARPGNRFWPAARAGGLVTADRDPLHALVEDGVGMTDLVKRATRRADALDASEYRLGLARLGRLVGRLRPRLVLFVGLAGWRAAVDRRAAAGPQPDWDGAAPAYVMPSTSGLNAGSSLEGLSAHMRGALASS